MHDGAWYGYTTIQNNEYLLLFTNFLFQMCSDQYFRHFRQLPSCDKNLDEEEEKARFHKNVESATLGSTRKVRTEDLVNVPI